MPAPPRLAVPLPVTGWQVRNARLIAIAERAEAVRPTVLRSLAVGGRSEWWWWVFPGLAVRCGCRSSVAQRSVNGTPLGPTGADLASPAEAAAYLNHMTLRAGLLSSLEAVVAAMRRHATRAPFAVLDAPVGGRAPEGAWTAGPLLAFRLFCCASLFAAVAHLVNDEAVEGAALAALRHFRKRDGLAYVPAGPGTAGHAFDVDDVARHRTPLYGADVATLLLVSRGVEWADALGLALEPTAGMRGRPDDELFERLDTSGDGVLDRRELLDCLLRAGQVHADGARWPDD